MGCPPPPPMIWPQSPVDSEPPAEDLVPVYANSIHMWDAILGTVRQGRSVLRKCAYCGRINQYDDRTSCPGCGAPIDPKQGDHR